MKLCDPTKANDGFFGEIDVIYLFKNRFWRAIGREFYTTAPEARLFIIARDVF